MFYLFFSKILGEANVAPLLLFVSIFNQIWNLRYASLDFSFYSNFFSYVFCR